MRLPAAPPRGRFWSLEFRGQTPNHFDILNIGKRAEGRKDSVS